jgi:hypothetical protein
MPPALTVEPVSPLLARFKRAILLVLLALTGWTAVLLASALYRSGRSPQTMGWALGIILAQAFLMLVSFAAFTALDRPRLRLPALTGMIAAAAMLAALPIFGWWQITDPLLLRQANHPDPAHYRMFQLAATGFLTAGLMCLIPFVLVPPMRRVARIVQLTTILYLTFAYLAAILFLWKIDTQRLDEALTTLLIPAGACMLGVFALHKFLEIRHPDPLTSVAPALHVRCPRCQCEQSLTLGESRCRRCRLRFTIAVEEPRCPNCHFNLHQLTRPICPECGFHLDEEDVPVATSPIIPPPPPEADPAAIPSAAAPQL